jgi:hypothetical protein
MLDPVSAPDDSAKAPSKTSRETPSAPDGDAPPSTRPGRLSVARFATTGRAAWALGFTFLGFHGVSWLIHEVTNPAHHAPVTFLAHLRHVPDEVALQLLFMPLAMHFAIPALLHPGNLFAWNPGYWTTRIFAVAYWFTLLASSRALIRSRRLVWLLVIGILLLATAPRFVELIGVALADN